MDEPAEIVVRAERYADRCRLELTDRLGGGTDGTVWKSNRKTAVKVFQYQKNYCMELGCYQRLRAHNITRIRQLAVPRLVESDDELMVVEMQIVTPPYLIDFGKAYLDSEPEHSPETWRDYHAEQQEIWEDRYKEVQAVLGYLRSIGIYYRDAKPGNLQF